MTAEEIRELVHEYEGLLADVKEHDSILTLLDGDSFIVNIYVNQTFTIRLPVPLTPEAKALLVNTIQTAKAHRTTRLNEIRKLIPIE